MGKDVDMTTLNMLQGREKNEGVKKTAMFVKKRAEWDAWLTHSLLTQLQTFARRALFARDCVWCWRSNTHSLCPEETAVDLADL